MTDSTPPSIPPRKRPTTPTTAGRQTTSAPRAPRAGSTTAWSEPAADDAATHVPGLNGSNGTAAFTVPSSTMPPTVAPTRTSTRPDPAPRATAERTATVEREPVEKVAPAPAAATTAISPQDRDSTSGPVGDEHDPPSPMMVAVDTATVWLKKAGVATSAAFTAATRPRPKEPTMTTTPAPVQAATPSTPRATTSTENLTGARPSTGRIPTVGQHGAPRRVRLAISRVDPWSVMKLSFLLSVAIGIMIVVAAAVIWFTLNGLQVFTKADNLVTQITGTESGIDILQYVEFSRIISGATLIAVIDVFLITALATIGAFLYNIVAALVGGVHVTMTDE
ncbi:DUF3566 domain-containing protein [Cellulomonas sp. ICMP 17802]|uniref:DUF3566 domain-containing protein n=1 Tax=Cellulomonas sp. ICMP 17802 TaxID=3239199 RepID=UPI00351BCCBC